MVYETSPRHEIARLVARTILFVGTIVAVWLIAPAAANALEPPDSVDDPVTEVTADPVDDLTDEAATITEAADEAIGSVTDAADATDVTATVSETADDAAETVTDAAGPAGSTAGDAATGAVDTVSRRVQDSVSIVDVQNTIDSVESSGDSVTVAVPTQPRVHRDDATTGPGDREQATGSRFADERAVTSSSLPLITGPLATPTASDSRAAASSSGAAMDVPVTPLGVPPPAMASTARDVARGDSPFDDLAATLAAIMIALGLVRWSRRENETVYSPIFLSLAGRPG